MEVTPRVGGLISSLATGLTMLVVSWWLLGPDPSRNHTALVALAALAVGAVVMMLINRFVRVEGGDDSALWIGPPVIMTMMTVAIFVVGASRGGIS